MLQGGSRRLFMSSSLPKWPLVVIVGATGTGKSQLAVSLAERFDGEVINGDALQMYEGLPITTNKTPDEERKGVPHHLLGCVKLGEEPWTVRQFHEGAGKVIQEIRSRGKLPVLVGGTHYYTQSLLFPNSLVENGDHSEHLREDEEERKWPILAADADVMLEELRRIDPTMALRWHPRDRRKIRRSLQIWLQTGKKASEIYTGQQESLNRHYEKNILDSDNVQFESLNNSKTDRMENAEGSALISSPVDYDPLIFWTYSAPEKLNERLERRVDSMVSAGLLDEVQSMHALMQTQIHQGNAIDDSRGIWIAIGFKELVPYVTSQARTEKELREGIEHTKIATRQYAKRQNRWIRLKLLPSMEEAKMEGKLFLLDATDISTFASCVENNAASITSAFLTGQKLPESAALSSTAKEMLFTAEKETRVTRHCEVCDKTMMSESQWVIHLKSKGHKNAVKPRPDWQALYPKAENS